MRTVLDDMQRDPSSAHKHMQVTLSCLSVCVCVCVCRSVGLSVCLHACVYLSGCFIFLQMGDVRMTANIEALKTIIETLQYKKNKNKKLNKWQDARVKANIETLMAAGIIQTG